MNTLVNIVKKMFTVKNSNSHLSQFKIWGEATHIFKEILDVLKKCSSPKPYLATTLKTSKPFVDHFSKHGMGLIEKYFKTRTEECKIVLKNIQLGIRYLHNICNWARLHGDAALAAQVPFLRKIFEELINR